MTKSDLARNKSPKFDYLLWYTICIRGGTVMSLYTCKDSIQVFSMYRPEIECSAIFIEAGKTPLSDVFNLVEEGLDYRKITIITRHTLAYTYVESARKQEWQERQANLFEYMKQLEKALVVAILENFRTTDFRVICGPQTDKGGRFKNGIFILSVMRKSYQEVLYFALSDAMGEFNIDEMIFTLRQTLGT